MVTLLILVQSFKVRVLAGQQINQPKMKNRILFFVAEWYAVILAFFCLCYSVSLGLYGLTDEALYSAHWAGTILLFSIAIRQRRSTR